MLTVIQWTRRGMGYSQPTNLDIGGAYLSQYIWKQTQQVTQVWAVTTSTSHVSNTYPLCNHGMSNFAKMASL